MPGLLLNYFGQGALIIEDPDDRPAGVLRAGAEGLHHRAGGALDTGRRHRLAGRHHRRLLADPPGDPARLPAAHGDQAHVRDRDRPDLYPARELDPDGRRRGAGRGFRLLGRAGRRLWPGRHRRHAGRCRPCHRGGDPGVALVVAAGRRACSACWPSPTSPSSSPTRSRSPTAAGCRWWSRPSSTSPSPPGGAAASWSPTELSEGSLPLRQFLERMERAPDRVAGTAVFLTADASHTPAAFLHNLKHNKVLHERIIILQVETMDVPRVPDANRVEVERLGKGFHTVIARYGFTEQPDVPAALRACRPHGIAYDEMETSFFLGRETLVPAQRSPLGQMAPRLVHLALALGLGDQDLLPHPAEPRYRAGQPDPDLMIGVTDGAPDARPAARPARTRAASSSPRSTPFPTSSTVIVPELWHYDSIAAMAEAALAVAPPTLRPRRLLDGRLRRLRGHAPRARTGRAAGADRHPGHARFGRGDGAPPRPASSRPRSAASMACSPRCCRRSCTAAHRRRRPSSSRSSTWRRKIGAEGFVREQRAIIARRRQPAAAGRHRRADRGDRRPPGPDDAAAARRRRWPPTSRTRGWWCSRNAAT